MAHFSSSPSIVLHFRITSFIAVVFIAGITGSLAAAPASSDALDLYPDIRILQMDAGGLTLEYRLLEVRYDTVSIGLRQYTNVQFYGAEAPERSDPRAPDLYRRSATIALPSAAAPSVEILQRDSRTVRGVRIPAVGDLHRDEEGGLYRVLPSDRADARWEEYRDAPPALVESIGEVRGVVLGTLRIVPVRPSGDGTSVELHDRLVIRIGFGGGGTMGRLDAATYETLGRVILNIEQVGRSESVQFRREGLRRSEAVQSGSVLSGGDWYTFTVEEEGMYRLSASALESAGIPVGSIDPGTLRLYSHGGVMLPEHISHERSGDLHEIAIHVQTGTDGRLEHIVFYGRGTTQWEYDAGESLFRHRYNYYTDRTVYFLTYGGVAGRRMEAQASLEESSPVRPQYFISHLVHREPLRNLLGSGREWMGETFNPGGVSVFTNALQGYTASVNEPIRYRVQVAARAPVQTRFRIADQSVQLGEIPMGGIHLDSETGAYASRGVLGRYTRTGTLPEGNRSALRFEYLAGDRSTGFLEWFEIHYPREFRAADDHLKFRGPDGGGVIEYSIGNFNSTQIAAYDVTDHSSVRRITGAAISPGASIRFQASQAAGSPRRYIAVAAAGYRSVGELEAVENSNVRGMAGGPELIIITHRDLLGEAERLRQHRETFAANSVSAVTIDVQYIYNEFSGGMPDPTAIRDFLHHAYNTWQPQPRYVLLFGAGSYDYRNVLEARMNYIPTYQSQESISRINTYTSDDFFVYFGEPLASQAMRPSMAIGRLNAVSPDDARVIVDKIIHYETNSDYGPWRNRVTFVADNHLSTGTRIERFHTTDTETLAMRYTPEQFEKRKIYALEYSIEQTAHGRRIPEANREIVRHFNDGTLLMNWMGHGNPRVWAHENIFDIRTTIPQLNNRDRLAFITAATCDFGRMDDPDEQSGAELLISREQGGAIGVLSASRIVRPFENARFVNTLYAHVLHESNGSASMRIGDALFATKSSYNQLNDIKYILLGDPTLRLLVPEHRAAIETINETSVEDTLELMALQKVHIHGTLRLRNGELLDDFTGRLSIEVYDSDRTIRLEEPPWTGDEYIKSGNVMFRGESSVSRGEFSSAFVVPKDISHEGDLGRIALYFWEDGMDGRGYTRLIRFGGIDTSAAADTEGPGIHLYLEDRNFRSGDLVSERPQLIVDLFDESGINISGGGIGHRIEAWLNDGEGIDLSDYYVGAVDSYQEGTVEYRLGELDAGPHHLRLRAWDVYNNSSVEEIFFQVSGSDRLSLQNVYNYPNPFGGETVFTFQHNQGVPIDVEIKVYTVAGRLIAQLRQYSVTDRFVRVPWSGRDDDGDRLANGVYLYKVVARTVDGEFTSEALGRMAVMR
jgi:hypothetical protein